MSRKLKQFSRGSNPNDLYTAENLLSEDNISKTLARLKSMKPIRLQTHEPIKRMALLIPICVVNRKASLLYVVKPANRNFNQEQTIFPGGLQQTNDKNLQRAALRETEQDLGVPPKNIHLWGAGNLIVTRGDFSILPFVGHVRGKLLPNKLTLGKNVEEAFAVPIEDLCNPRKNGYTQFRNSYSAPVFTGSKRRIWGLTGMITSLLLKALLTTRGYTHRVKFIPSVQKGGGGLVKTYKKRS